MPQRPNARNLFERNEAITNEDFKNRVIVYENKSNLEDLNHHILGLLSLWKPKKGKLPWRPPRSHRLHLLELESSTIPWGRST